MAKKGKNAGGGLILILAVIFLASKCGGDEPTPAEIAKQAKLDERRERSKRLNSQPLRVTEVSGEIDLGWESFRFCTNKYIHWRIRAHSADVQATYSLTMNDGRSLSGPFEVDVLSFNPQFGTYDKTNPDSQYCHKIGLGDVVSGVPWLQYQRGYSARDNPEMDAKEKAELKAFVEGISSIQIRFEPSGGKEPLSVIFESG